MKQTRRFQMNPIAAAAADKGNPFLSLTPDDMQKIHAIANRAQSIAQAWRAKNGKHDQVLEVNAQVSAIDIAVTHLHRKLNLSQFLMLNDLDFIAEYALIQQHINRPLKFFPRHVELRCAQNRA